MLIDPLTLTVHKIRLIPLQNYGFEPIFDDSSICLTESIWIGNNNFKFILSLQFKTNTKVAVLLLSSGKPKLASQPLASR